MKKYIVFLTIIIILFTNVTCVLSEDDYGYFSNNKDKNSYNIIQNYNNNFDGLGKIIIEDLTPNRNYEQYKDIWVCFKEASEQYNINYYLLLAIAKTESNFTVRAINYNRNGTYDLGIMQINSSWLPILKISKDILLNDPCYNINVGAWVLSQCISKFGNNWRSIDCYNKGARSRVSSEYVWKVYKNYKSLILAYKEDKKVSEK